MSGRTIHKNISSVRISLCTMQCTMRYVEEDYARKLTHSERYIDVSTHLAFVCFLNASAGDFEALVFVF